LCRQAKKPPFVDVPDPPHFAIKIIATIFLTNLSGYGFYCVRGLSAAGAGRAPKVSIGVNEKDYSRRALALRI
jgi:hypothetical protein